MGNSQGKESRSLHSPSRSDVTTQNNAPTSPNPELAANQSASERPGIASYSSRSGRGSRADLSFLGIGNHGDRDPSSLETRRETKQEREARKLEKERAARLKERERSMREEHVDGGYLVTQGVYVGTEDYNKAIVRQLMIERRLAPFWLGLNDFSESWAEHQLMAAARGMEIPPADQVPPELEYRLASKTNTQEPSPSPEKNIKKLTVPIGSRSQSYNSDSSTHLSPGFPTFSLPSPTSPMASPPTSTSIFRTRAKTLASLTTSSRNNSQTEMTPRELQLPRDPFVNGQPIEVYLYKEASECPICFLYYPPYLNTTRCCDQAICSECFVQIKRPDPHPPEHEHPESSASPPPQPPAVDPAADGEDTDGQLVSEPSTCPFCKMPEFGVTYAPPPFRRGLSYGSGPHAIGRQASAMSSQSSLASGNLSPGSGRRRGTSLSTTAPGVITTDRIRPDWATKLASARAHQARRSAAATALHTAAYLMGGVTRGEGPDTRSFGPFGRRLRRNGDGSDSPGSSSAHLNALAFLAERHQQQQARQRAESGGSNDGPPSINLLPPPRNSSSRRSRVDDLEEMMMMEAIRLSLASEEDRRRREEKDAKKEAKKKDKADRKAGKAAKKSGVYQMNSNTSSTGNFDSGDSMTGSGMLGRTESGSSLLAQNSSSSGATGKGKAVERDAPTSSTFGTAPLSIPTPPSQTPKVPSLSLSPSNGPTGTSQPSNSPTFPPNAADPVKRSHLRHMSNASSSASSYIDQTGTSIGTDNGFPGSSTPPGADSGSGDGGAGNEPMFNFRSLAATLIDEEEHEEKNDSGGSNKHIENVNGDPNQHHQRSHSEELAAEMGIGSVDEITTRTKEPHRDAYVGGDVQERKDAFDTGMATRSEGATQ